MSVLRVIVVCLLQCAQTHELQIISNSKAKTVSDVLYINWNVNTRMLHNRNASGPFYFQVYFCPLDTFLERKNCLEVNITLCNATYQRLPYISANISTRQDKLQDYVKTGRRGSLFSENSSANITGEWNETNAKFICAVHNIDECWSAYKFPRTIKGQILITASYVNVKEKVLLDVKQNQEPSKFLNRPDHITLVQRNKGTVTIGWKACLYDGPIGFNISFHDTSGNILKCRSLIKEEEAFSRNWKYNCTFANLRPYTSYTVKVYSYTGLKLQQSLPGIKTFRTNEQAPSRQPSFECVVCQEHILKNGNRIVNIRWKLPPKDTLNGMVRRTKLKYWAKDDFEHGSGTAKIITYRNLTTKGSIELKVDLEYFVQVKICTLGHLCCDYNERMLIPKIRKRPHSLSTAGNSKILVIALVIGPVTVIFVLIFGAILCWRKQNQRRREEKNNPLEDLKQPDSSEGFSSSTDSKINRGYPRKDSLQSEYNELPPPDNLELEENGNHVLPAT